jgi:hypothetical protein
MQDKEAQIIFWSVFLCFLWKKIKEFKIYFMKKKKSVQKNRFLFFENWNQGVQSGMLYDQLSVERLSYHQESWLQSFHNVFFSINFLSKIGKNHEDFGRKKEKNLIKIRKKKAIGTEVLSFLPFSFFRNRDDPPKPNPKPNPEKSRLPYRNDNIISIFI